MMLRKNAEKNNAVEIADLLKSAEYALIAAIAGVEGLTLKSQGDLVTMQRRLRQMRCAIECEARIW